MNIRNLTEIEKQKLQLLLNKGVEVKFSEQNGTPCYTATYNLKSTNIAFTPDDSDISIEFNSLIVLNYLGVDIHKD